MDSHQQHLHRGFNWLGGAMIIAKITDFGAILIVLRFLTKDPQLAEISGSVSVDASTINSGGTTERVEGVLVRLP